MAYAKKDTKDLSFMLGKTIAKIKFRGIKGCDDVPYLDITFSDGTEVTFCSDYGGYTGNSEDDYPRYISIML